MMDVSKYTVVITLYTYQRSFTSIPKNTPYHKNNHHKTNILTTATTLPTTTQLPRKYCRLFTPSYNKNINTHTHHPILNKLYHPYPNLNIIVLGGLQHTISSITGYRMCTPLPLPPHLITSSHHLPIHHSNTIRHPHRLPKDNVPYLI